MGVGQGPARHHLASFEQRRSQFGKPLAASGRGDPGRFRIQTIGENRIQHFRDRSTGNFLQAPTGRLHAVREEDDGALLELGLGPGVAVCGLVDLLILSITVSFVFFFILSVFILGLFLRLVVEVLYEACAVVLTDDVDEQLWELVLLGQFDSFGYVAFDD